MSDLLKASDPDNLLNYIKQLESRLLAVERAFVSANSAEELVAEIGELPYRAVNDEGALVMIMSAVNLLEELGVDAHLIGFDPETGVAQVWINAATGKITAGAGTTTIGADGIVVNGLNKLLKFVAENSGNTGTGVIRMRVDSASKPILSISLEEGMTITNLFTDESFESGAFSPNWTPGSDLSIVAIPTPDVDIAPYDGSKMVEFYGAGITQRELHSASRIAVTEGKTYAVSARVTANGSGISSTDKISVFAMIAWYTAASGGTLLRTDQLDRYDSTGLLAWAELAGNAQAPIGATHADVYFIFQAYSVGLYGWLDNAIFYEAASIGEILVGSDILFSGAPTRHEPIDFEPDVPDAGAYTWADLKTNILKTKSNFLGAAERVGGIPKMTGRLGFGLTAISASPWYLGINTDTALFGTITWGTPQINKYGMLQNAAMSAGTNGGLVFPNTARGITGENILFSVTLKPASTSTSGKNLGIMSALPTVAPVNTGTYCVFYITGAGGAIKGRTNVDGTIRETSTLPVPLSGETWVLSFLIKQTEQVVEFYAYNADTDLLYTESISLSSAPVFTSARFALQSIRASGTVSFEFYHAYAEVFGDHL